uniref:Uncharacterized protein n=1 Tax=Takifugu rubripes TaxID=31033 RepID=A0A674MVB8_TAKRU
MSLLSSLPPCPFWGHEEGAHTGEGWVHPSMSPQFIARPSVIIFGFGSLLKGTSEVINSKNNCYYQSYNISLEGSSFTFDDGSSNATFIHTSCPDCILISFNGESGDLLYFYLFSRRRQLEEKEMEEFRRQVGCLKMPPPFVMNPANELCPEEGTSEAAVE